MFALGAPLAFVLLLGLCLPVSAEEAVQCLTREQQRSAIVEGRAVPLAAVRRTLRQRMPGEVVRARLCQRPDRLIYLLTVLARDGKVARAVVDASNGAVIGGP